MKFSEEEVFIRKPVDPKIANPIRDVFWEAASEEVDNQVWKNHHSIIFKINNRIIEALSLKIFKYRFK